MSDGQPAARLGAQRRDAHRLVPNLQQENLVHQSTPSTHHLALKAPAKSMRLNSANLPIHDQGPPPLFEKQRRYRGVSEYTLVLQSAQVQQR